MEILEGGAGGRAGGGETRTKDERGVAKNLSLPARIPQNARKTEPIIAIVAGSADSSAPLVAFATTPDAHGRGARAAPTER